MQKSNFFNTIQQHIEIQSLTPYFTGEKKTWISRLRDSNLISTPKNRKNFFSSGIRFNNFIFEGYINYISYVYQVKRWLAWMLYRSRTGHTRHRPQFQIMAFTIMTSPVLSLNSYPHPVQTNSLTLYVQYRTLKKRLNNVSMCYTHIQNTILLCDKKKVYLYL